MISSLRGVVLHAGLDSLVLEVGGVGFAVAVTPEVARRARPGEELQLHTHLVVREDALSLFGFSTRAELDVFGIMLGVSGVGPKSALGVLGALSIDQIAEAVQLEDDRPFRKVSGIGPKTAKLIVVQLQGKLAPPSAPTTAPTGVAGDVLAQVTEAVSGLGWPERVASEAVAAAAEAASEADRASMQALLRLTLAALGPANGASRV